MKVSTKELLWKVKDAKTLKALDNYDFIVIINFIFRVGKLCPSSQAPDFLDKVLLEHGHTVRFYTLTPQVQGWTVVTRDHRLHKPECIY